MIDLSIIVPVYNVEKYVRPCIESIFKQGLDDSRFEVIIVNDGSTDHSMEMIADIIQAHSNITVINQENLSLSVARNNGIAVAKGEYIMMPDSDDLLIDAFHLFAQKNSEWMLDIVGEGPEEKMYRQKIAEYQLEKRILIHPFTNNIQAYYSQAQVYVLSSRWEGFGLVLVEAMAHGLPIVSSDLPTSKEIMGDFGLYFQNGNVEDLAEKLLEATQLDWKKKSEEAFTITNHFNLSIIAEQWREIL